MLNGRRRWVALAAAAGVLVVGASAGVAATGSADNGFLAGVAKRLGISEDKLTDAIRDESIARIDQAAQDGELSKEQAERLKERARSGGALGPLGRGSGPGPLPGFAPGPGFGLERGFGHVFRAAGDQLEAAADYLGLTRAELIEELTGGDSLAKIAKAKGKSVAGLKTAMKNALEKDLDAAVDDGVLTQEQADDLSEKLSAGIDRLVERGLGLPRGFGRGFGFGFGGGNVLETAAGYLGLTEAQLRKELSDGDSLADVAKAKGKSVAGLKTALRNALKKDLDKAVDDGAITREHADEMLEELSGHLDGLVENELRAFGFSLKFGGPDGPDFEFRRGSGANLPGILPLPEPPAVQDAGLDVF